MTTPAASRWIAAAKALAEDPKAVVACPERADGVLVVQDVSFPDDPTRMERYLVCITCGARNVIRMEDHRALRAALSEAAGLLEAVGERHWSAKLRAAGRRSLDPVEVRSWFGGMGSLNDVLVSRLNGHQVRPEDEGAMNERLRDLRRRIFELARALGP